MGSALQFQSKDNVLPPDLGGDSLWMKQLSRKQARSLQSWGRESGCGRACLACPWPESETVSQTGRLTQLWVATDRPGDGRTGLIGPPAGHIYQKC